MILVPGSVLTMSGRMVEWSLSLARGAALCQPCPFLHGFYHLVFSAMLSTNITLTNLPELYQIIIKHYLHTAARGPNDLDQRKIDTHHWLEQHRRLYPLLFVSREMYHEVTRIIYCNTSINLENANGRGFRLLRLMATSEHLAVRVVVLELTTKTTPNILEREQVGLVEITDLLLACLRRMSYLTTWNFTHSSGPLPYILQLLTDECPFSLKQMRLTCHQELDPFFWPFIQSQPNITVFGCASYTGKNLNTPADSRLLPIVEKMDVSGFVAATILQTGPRSQLTHLRINKRSPSDPPWSNTNSIRYLFINSTGQSLSETLNLSSFPQLIHVFLLCFGKLTFTTIVPILIIPIWIGH